MTALRLLAELRAQGVELRAEGDRLRWRAPTGAVTPDVLRTLATVKVEILELLRGEEPPPSRVEDEPIVQLAASLLRATLAGGKVPDESGHPTSHLDTAALRTAGWKGPGPLEGCLVCGRGTVWLDPEGRPRHPWCEGNPLDWDPDLDGGGCNGEDDYLPPENRSASRWAAWSVPTLGTGGPLPAGART